MTQRAVGYVRVSSEEQVQGLSLDAQRHAIERFCADRGLALGEVFTDAGVSAFTDRLSKRPAFRALLEAADRHEFDVVVVHTVDRWARRASVGMPAWDRLGRAGVGFMSVTENVDWSRPEGRMMLGMLGLVAEFFSHSLGGHVRKAREEAFAQGRPVGGVPFGYRWIPGEGRVAGTVRVEPAEAAAVREVFARRAAGFSYGAIARLLNDGGHGTRRGNGFTSFAVKDMLRCRFYVGEVSLRDPGAPRRGAGKTAIGQHEALIDAELFARVESMRIAHHAAKRPAFATAGALAGRVRCWECGRPLWSDRGRAKGSTARYREQHGRFRAPGVLCGMHGRSVDARIIDEQIGRVFGAIRLDDDLLELALSAMRDQFSDSRDTADGIMNQQRRDARAYADGAFTDAEYTARRAALEARLTALRRPGADVEAAAALVRDLPRLWAQATVQERRELLGALVAAVYVDVDLRRVVALEALPDLDTLLQEAVTNDEAAPVVLEPGRPQSWAMVETGEN